MTILLRGISYLDIENEKIISDVDIYIKDKKINKIGKGLSVSASEIIDCKNKLAIPALVNSHSHLGMTMMRNLADDLDLNTWLNEKIWPLEAKLTKEDIYYSSLLSIIENIKSGTGLVCDMYYELDKVSEAIAESGIKGVLSRGLTDIAGDGDEKIHEFIEFYKDYNDLEDRVKIIPGPHAIYTCSTEYLKSIIKLSEKYDVMLNIHLSETKKEVKDSINKYGKTPAMYLNDIGLFERKVIAAHCTHLTEEEIKLISKKEVYPIYNPTSNLKLASGFTRVSKMLDENIIMGIGTDGSSSNNNQDMIEEMHIGAIVNKAVDLDPKSVRAIDILRMATINGAKILGLTNGIIKEGSKADLTIFNLDSNSFTPKNNLISALAYSANREDVDSLIVDGKFIMKKREILSLDEEKIRYMVNKLYEKLENR